MKKLILLVAALFVVAGTQFSLQLAPQAVIEVEAWSPQQLHDLHMDIYPSSGLPLVGVGQLVYLKGSEAEGEAVVSFEWKVTSPGGFDVSIADQGGERMTFRPDAEGRPGFRVDEV